MTFEEIGLSPETLRVLSEMNFINPTPIQEKAIPQLLEMDTDLMGLAQTGTGKTAAFALPILEKIELKTKKPQALILCPTRELCLQITADIEKFTKYHKNIRTVAVYGGASIGVQIRDLRRGVQIVVATPGRLIDIIERGEINFEAVKIAVLDEADEMLNMGFKEDITKILSNTPDEKNTWLFTATMPRDIKSIAKKYMKDPVEVAVSASTGNENIDHQYYLINPRDRYATLKRIVDFYPDIFGIVFCRTKRETKEIADMLIKDGYNSDALHGDLTQQQRDIVMNRYRERSLQLLIATDVAARGIDVTDVTHVINFALPDDPESYTHRSGRTARAGKKGISIALISNRELRNVSAIERKIGKKFERVQVPTGEEVCEKQLFALVNRAKEVKLDEEQLGRFMDRLNSEFEEMSKEEVIKRFASMEFNRFIDYYRDSRDLNNVRDNGRRGDQEDRYGKSDKGNRFERGRREQRPRGENGAILPQSGYVRFFINVGDSDRLNKGELLRLVCDHTGIRGVNVGRIDMKDKFSFFEVEKKYKMDIINNVKGLSHNGRGLRVDVASEGSVTSGSSSRDRFSRSERGNSSGRDHDTKRKSSKRSPKREKEDSFKLDFNFDGGF